MNKIISSLALIFFLIHSTNAMAYSSRDEFLYGRGGICQSGFCSFTATIVLIALILAFLVTLIASISEHGLLKGLLKHGGLQVIAAYTVIMLGPIFAIGYLMKSAGKEWGIIGILIYMAILMMLDKGIFKKNKNNKDIDP